MADFSKFLQMYILLKSEERTSLFDYLRRREREEQWADVVIGSLARAYSLLDVRSGLLEHAFDDLSRHERDR